MDREQESQWKMIREKYRGQRCQRWSLSEAVDRDGWREELWTELSDISERVKVNRDGY